MENSMISICFSAITAVFFVLIFLAVVIRLITFIFPYKASTEETEGDETEVFAAINATYSKLFPEGRVTEITLVEDKE